MVEMRPYQTEALRAIGASMAAGERRGLLVLPTGAGKTIVFATLIANTGGRSLVLVHRDELARQTVDKLLAVRPDVMPGIVQGLRNEHTAPVVVASVQTLSRLKRLAQVAPDFSLVVTDESHHATADSYQRIYEHVLVGMPGGPYHLGVTATPARTDKQDLQPVFERIVYEAFMEDLIEQGFLCPMRGKTVKLGLDLDRVRVRHGDFKAGALSRAMIAANANELIANAYLEHAQGRRAIAFLPSVELAEMVFKALSTRGIPSAVVTGETPLETRQDVYAGLREGAIKVVSSCMVLTEGFDEPSVDCIIVGRPTKSLPLYMQMVGRGSRPSPGKQDCLVIDIAAITRRHKIQSLSDLFGVEPKPKAPPVDIFDGDGDGEGGPEGEEIKRIDPEFMDVDLFLSNELAWVQTRGGHLTLGLKDFSILGATRTGEGWLLSHVTRGQPEELLTQGDFKAVSRAAQLFADSHESKWWVRRESFWRQQPATEKQRNTLRSMGHDLGPAATKGEASDLFAHLLNDRTIMLSRRMRAA
jgi:superfamily II DNA or RNA helicase